MNGKLVVLDGFTLNPGDLSWDGFAKLATIEVHDRTPGELIVPRAADAELVLTNKTPLDAETISRLPRLRYIGVLATGYDCVDARSARERGIVVTNVPAYGAASVAQFTFALLLELCHHVAFHADAVRQGRWSSHEDFSFSLAPQIELAGKTLGVVGCGRIGRQVARIGGVMGMKILVTGRTGSGQQPEDEFRRVNLEPLLAESDVVTLHCPLSTETRGMINARTLGLMKPTAFLINTARGGLIVEKDLAAALNAGRIAGAALDVLSIEPPSSGTPLLQAKNCLVTPHIAWATREARARLMKTAVENAAAFLAGTPQNVVNQVGIGPRDGLRADAPRSPDGRTGKGTDQ